MAQTDSIDKNNGARKSRCTVPLIVKTEWYILLVWYAPRSVGGTQGWEFAHLLIAHLLIRSDHSNQMSDCEQFAQIAKDK